MSSLKPAATRSARKPSRRAATKAPRKAPAPSSHRAAAPASADAALTADAKRLAAEIERRVADGQPAALGPDALKALMGALCRAYSARVENGDDIMPLASRSAVSPTDVMRAASGLLRAADLQVFELGMWQSWTGR